jgi:hypothetical protein
LKMNILNENFIFSQLDFVQKCFWWWPESGSSFPARLQAILSPRKVFPTCQECDEWRHQSRVQIGGACFHLWRYARLVSWKRIVDLSCY